MQCIVSALEYTACVTICTVSVEWGAFFHCRVIVFICIVRVEQIVMYRVGNKCTATILYFTVDSSESK